MKHVEHRKEKDDMIEFMILILVFLLGVAMGMMLVYAWNADNKK